MQLRCVGWIKTIQWCPQRKPKNCRKMGLIVDRVLDGWSREMDPLLRFDIDIYFSFCHFVFIFPKNSRDFPLIPRNFLHIVPSGSQLLGDIFPPPRQLHHTILHLARLVALLNFYICLKGFIQALHS